MDAPGAVDGEAHHADGPVMLVWPSARREAGDLRLGRDVVLHEIAHKLDMLDGTLDGTPPIADDDAAPALGRGVHAPSTTPCARATSARVLRPTPAPTRPSSSPSPPRRSSPARSTLAEPQTRRCTRSSPRSTARTPPRGAPFIAVDAEAGRSLAVNPPRIVVRYAVRR